MTSWEIHGLDLSNCNCAYGCPCQFAALPTEGNCQGIGAFKIESGFYGETTLDGLSAVIAVKWPGPIHEGNAERQIFIDERADSSQREALEKIMSGEDTNDMATLAWVINATTATRHETMFRPIRIEADITKRTGKVIVDGVLEINSEPIKNPVTGEPHRARIDSPEGVEFSIAEMASGTTKTHGGKMEFTDANDTHCHIAELHWNNAGVIRN